jgi:hypothetical protein
MVFFTDADNLKWLDFADQVKEVKRLLLQEYPEGCKTYDKESLITLFFTKSSCFLKCVVNPLQCEVERRYITYNPNVIIAVAQDEEVIARFKDDFPSLVRQWAHERVISQQEKTARKYLIPYLEKVWATLGGSEYPYEEWAKRDYFVSSLNEGSKSWDVQGKAPLGRNENVYRIYWGYGNEGLRPRGY